MKTVRIVAMIGILWFSSSAPCFAQRTRTPNKGPDAILTILQWLHDHGPLNKYEFWGKYPRVFSMEKNGKLYWYKGEQRDLLYIPLYVENLHQITFQNAYDMMTYKEKEKYNIFLYSILSLSKPDPSVVMTEWDLPFWDAFGGKLLLLVLFFFLLASWASDD